VAQCASQNNIISTAVLLSLTTNIVISVKVHSNCLLADLGGGVGGGVGCGILSLLLLPDRLIYERTNK